MNTYDNTENRRPGDRDHAFGDQGEVSLQRLPYIDGSDRLVKGLSTLPLDKILVSVRVSHQEISHWGLARLLGNGELDSTFANQGFTFGRFKDNFEASGGQLLSHEQSIYMLGWTMLARDSSDPSLYLTLSRFTEHGTLDPTFADQGTLIIAKQREESLVADSGHFVVQQADNKLLIGATYQHIKDEMTTVGVVYRVTPQGVLDTSLNNSGRLDITLNAASTAVTVNNVQTHNGRDILVAGSIRLPEGEQGYFARYKADGSVDTTFGDASTPGVYRFAVEGNNTLVQGLIHTDDGRFVAFGKTERVELPSAGLLIGMSASGKPDPQFNRGQPLLSVFDEKAGNHWRSGFRDASGRLTLVGSVLLLHVARFLADGAPDFDFGQNGHITENTSTREPALIQARSGARLMFAGNVRNLGRFIGALRGYLS
ncbi:hypothetical protein EI534_15365 [Pseudomonas frederiksbergensis]|nr:hypothetical protein [Pseudomonas frederiksbergensis]